MFLKFDYYLHWVVLALVAILAASFYGLVSAIVLVWCLLLWETITSFRHYFHWYEMPRPARHFLPIFHTVVLGNWALLVAHFSTNLLFENYLIYYGLGLPFVLGISHLLIIRKQIRTQENRRVRFLPNIDY